jgi:hypothetical protein
MTADVHFSPPQLQSKLQSISGARWAVRASGGRPESDRRQAQGPGWQRFDGGRDHLPGALPAESPPIGLGPVTHQTAVSGT